MTTGLKIRRRVLAPLMLTAALLPAALALPAAAQIGPVQGEKAAQQAVLALGGYDIMTYYSDGRPRRGSPLITLVHDGHIFRFESQENRALFAQSPDLYAPEFGNSCAFALAKGKVVFAAEPATYVVENNKLYFFSSEGARDKWKTDPQGNIAAGRRTWAESGDTLTMRSFKFESKKLIPRPGEK